MSYVTLINGLNNPRNNETIVVRAGCTCGFMWKEFEVDLGHAKSNWTFINQKLMNIGSDWNAKNIHECERVEMTEKEYQKKIKDFMDEKIEKRRFTIEPLSSGELNRFKEGIEWARKNPPPEIIELIKTFKKEVNSYDVPLIAVPELIEAITRFEKKVRS